MNANVLYTDVAYIKGIGPSRAKLLQSELGIKSYADLLHFFPNRYIDKTQYYSIAQINDFSADIQLIGKIIHLKTVAQKRGKRLVASFKDDTGVIELVWFSRVNQIKEILRLNEPYVIFGKPKRFGKNYTITHPEMELLSEHEKGIRVRMQPIYPSTEKLSNSGISNRMVSKWMQQLLLSLKNDIAESLSSDILDKNNLMPKVEALKNMHFPQNQELLTRAMYRMKFEEFFFLQLQLVTANLANKRRYKGFAFDKIGHFFSTFYKEHLPFELTNAQKRVIKEIRKDIGSGIHMNRLLQGDVGSGKTIVALLVILIAIDNGFQATLMAPTEILATQHYNGLVALTEEMDISIALLTGSTRTKERRRIHEELENGKINLLVGTHAVLEDKVQFKNLGIAITDEQHRFGVAQRAKLWKKNTIPPHILVMTATPIPRTLAMSLYGDLDISVIDELPPGRKEIKTVHRYDKNRLSIFKFIKDEIEKGRQIYVVYPLIEESETLDYKDLMDGYESIQRAFPLPDYALSIVHGKMKPADKEYEMQRFVKGETQIMVATTVIEVGVNVPNASVMIIESAERFGLSQLHQLRGRVGRGAEQSFCILVSGHKLSNEAKTRLQTMTETNDGFKIAEVDLKLRGPGNIMGTQQSGVLQLKVGDLVRDGGILSAARQNVLQLLQNDPKLSQPQNYTIRKTFENLSKKHKDWKNIS